MITIFFNAAYFLDDEFGNDDKWYRENGEIREKCRYLAKTRRSKRAGDHHIE